MTEDIEVGKGERENLPLDTGSKRLQEELSGLCYMLTYGVSLFSRFSGWTDGGLEEEIVGFCSG